LPHGNGGRWLGITDPVTIVFYGSALSGRVWADLKYHSGWTHNDPDDFLGFQIAHMFRDGHGGCAEQHNELANKPGYGRSRFHTRLSNTQHRDTNGNYHVFLTPHHEVWRDISTGGSGCKSGTHAVDPGHHDPDNKGNKYYEPRNSQYYSGFDHGRDQVIHHMSRNPAAKRHHKIEYHQWRNTRSVKQCNGWYSGSSGVTYGITIGRVGG
jgi:hypothetical protein